ncbi:MAG: phosphoadenosine phosphosulfate reductase family protein [Bdellovibrionales bacterium]|nr:phosphoadenosine phosphosulfate reductase family protein [Bdellovibrionales bacterium]
MFKFKYDEKRRQICPLSGGKDSTALAIFLKDKIPNLEYVFCDTGSELPETYEYLDKLEAFLCKKIVRLNSEKNFDYLLKKHSDYLPSPRARWCTIEMKIKSFEKYIGEDLIESYIGIRADENRQGYISKKDTIFPRYPFKEEGIDINGVNKILKDSGIGLPKYYEWRVRSGCYFCFFQRKIEWVGLLEKHPELFEKAKKYETQNYKGDHVCFTWIEGQSLKDIEKNKEQIKKDYQKRMEKALKKQKGKNITDVFKETVNDDDQEDACLICDL